MGRYPFSSLGDLPNPGIKPNSPELQADSLPSEPPGKPENTAVSPQFHCLTAVPDLHDLKAHFHYEYNNSSP